MRPALALRPLLLLAAVRFLLHTLTNGQYGFHRDELAFLADARNLDWCFPAYPPLTPFLARLALTLLGDSTTAVRTLTALAQCAVMFTTGMIARELGASPRAQILAALASFASPVSLIAGHLFQYMSFDFLWSVLLIWIVLRLINTENPRWLLAAGLICGLGLLTRYTIVIVIAGLAAGLLLTPARRLLFNRHLLYGSALALLLCAPTLLWQINHNYLALDFTSAIHARDIRIGRTDGFLLKQFVVPAHLLTVPLWIAGLWFLLRRPEAARHRPIAFGFLISLALYTLAQARDYYTAPLYPALLAAGSLLAVEWRSWLRRTQYAAIALAIISTFALFVPAAPPGTAWFRTVMSINGDLAEEIGWPEFVAATAAVYNALPPAERAATGILASNYGEAGALVHYGPAHNLPPVMSRVNSFWLRGYDPRQPQTLIATGFSREFVDRHFQSCELKGHITNSLGVANDETKFNKYIWLCRNPRDPWPILWQKIRVWS